MKILHVCKKYPDALGGDAVVVSNLVKQQEKRGDICVIITSNCDEIRNDQNVIKVGLKDTPQALDSITLKRLISLIILYFKSYKIIKSFKPDVIHSESIDMTAAISFAARRYKVPMIHTFQILTFYDNNQSNLRRKTELLLLKIARPNKVTLPNKTDAIRVKKKTNQDVEVLHNGVNVKDWRIDRNKNKNKEFVFISVGRLEPQKGFDKLIEASAMLREKTGKKFRVDIIGSGGNEQKLSEQIQELNLENHVKLLGRKTESQVKDIYSQADCMIITSLYETGPITLVEAWAAGLPVLSTKVGILQNNSSFRNAALLLEQNSDDISNSMYEIIESKILAKNLQENGCKIANIFDWNNIGKQSINIYKNIVAEQGMSK